MRLVDLDDLDPDHLIEWATLERDRRWREAEQCAARLAEIIFEPTLGFYRRKARVLAGEPT